MTTWRVEFWPGKAVDIEIEDDATAEDAVVAAVTKYGWLGGSEFSGGAQHFQMWVRKKGE